ncbi:DUF2306 domain-containing protein [Allokutzneria sp. A3M-2-11 16]|uniref:DUF2306 domain-containing protein n=1 Tax=Allokutzneria sp. A3M-2-11 16 TaxID=2962043 RepID=UPI0020B83CDF|nr:DUF2306 domain-containing protein [Allokutzneria sp. A3M-2-11 16]MCP3804648.1 DUF2306 domain-containing protein [Allokutzneria sp. A3M-2-11 16]
MLRRPWMAPLALVVLVFLVVSLPGYLSLDPARSRLPSPPDFPAYYPILVSHIIFGSIAMVTCCLQIWPWLRSRDLALHRRIGRVYVFAGVLPAGVLGFVVGVNTPFGPVAMVSHVLLAALWLGTTAMGVISARKRRMAEHRRWMIRSFALTMSIITNRLWSALAAVALEPRIATTFGGSEIAFMHAIGSVSAWLGWTIPLLIAQWWLDRTPTRRRTQAHSTESVTAA